MPDAFDLIPADKCRDCRTMRFESRCTADLSARLG
jgi:hypothetical protein